jgi:ADP-heptose:LPS heptosyltransferase
MPADFTGHISEFLIEQLQNWSAGQTAARQILRSVNDRGLQPSKNPDGPILIHPGSGAARKNWPPEKFLQLIEKLRADGRAVKSVLGEVELEQWPKELISRYESINEVVRPKNLLELFAQLAAASAFVGNDSGPSHLAGILGLPTVSIFGGTSNPVHWKPLGPRVRVLQEPLEHLDVDSVVTALG